jgi:hypothetical protein
VFSEKVMGPAGDVVLARGAVGELRTHVVPDELLLDEADDRAHAVAARVAFESKGLNFETGLSLYSSFIGSRVETGRFQAMGQPVDSTCTAPPCTRPPCRTPAPGCKRCKLTHLKANFETRISLDRLKGCMKPGAFQAVGRLNG